MWVVTVCNHKGGCGKTTTSINLAAYLALKGKKVLLIDLDPQGATSTGLGIDKWHLERHMYDVMVNETPLQEIVLPTEIPGLFIAPCNIDLSGAEPELASQIARELILKEKIQPLKDFDYIIIDTPPSLWLLTINSLIPCSLLLIPLQSEFYALEGMSQLLKIVKMVETRLGSKPTRRVLLTMYDARTNLSKQVAEQVRDYFKDQVFQTIIPRNVKLAEAPSHGKPICLYDPESAGAEAYERLSEEVMQLGP
ncbi:Nitrogenase iron protein [uncultured archaeon]|nr:Nitrogenase iron protein [uncultured archaeon]